MRKVLMLARPIVILKSLLKEDLTSTYIFALKLALPNVRARETKFLTIRIFRMWQEIFSYRFLDVDKLVSKREKLIGAHANIRP